MLDYEKRKNLLESYGLDLPKGRVFTESDSAVEFAENVGYPVVAKLEGDLAHKTEKGGVFTDLNGNKELREALNNLFEKREEVLIQNQVEGVELVIGGREDSVFGPVIMTGLGGILVELLEDVTFRVAPINEGEAAEMIEEIKNRELLEGFRGKPSVDKDKFSEVLVSLSELIYEEDISEMDLNPVIANRNKFLITDAKIYE